MARLADLAGLVESSLDGQALRGDTDCVFRVLAGDINGTSPPYGDGKTDLSDLATAKANAMSGSRATEGTCRFDVNLDGRLDLTDMALVKILVFARHEASCP